MLRSSAEIQAAKLAESASEADGESNLVQIMAKAEVKSQPETPLAGQLDAGDAKTRKPGAASPASVASPTPSPEPPFSLRGAEFNFKSRHQRLSPLAATFTAIVVAIPIAIAGTLIGQGQIYWLLLIPLASLLFAVARGTVNFAAGKPILLGTSLEGADDLSHASAILAFTQWAARRELALSPSLSLKIHEEMRKAIAASVPMDILGEPFSTLATRIESLHAQAAYTESRIVSSIEKRIGDQVASLAKARIDELIHGKFEVFVQDARESLLSKDAWSADEEESFREQIRSVLSQTSPQDILGPEISRLSAEVQRIGEAASDVEQTIDDRIERRVKRLALERISQEIVESVRLTNREAIRDTIRESEMALDHLQGQAETIRKETATQMDEYRRTARSGVKVESSVVDSAEERFRRLGRDAEVTIARTMRRASIHLGYGIFFGLAGAAAGVFPLLTNPGLLYSSWNEVIGAFMARAPIIVILEIMALFFLRLYRTALADLAFAQDQARAIEERALALKLALLLAEAGESDPIKGAVQVLFSSGIRSPTLLSQGQTTERVEQERVASDHDLEFMKNLASIVSSKRE